MADLTPKQVFQPSLLDRLTDDHPARQSEAVDRRFLSIGRLREAVRRDLAFLMNATHLSAVQDLSAYPLVESSTLNFGIPDLAGRPASSIKPMELARNVHRAILAFEPRLLRGTLHVEAVVTADEHGRNSLHFDIRADLWCQPAPVRLRFRTELNLEDGEARVLEAAPG